MTRGATFTGLAQQSLRRTLEWSYNLLDPVEQQLFDRLGVFRGGWTVEAAHAICNLEGSSETDSLDNLSQLLDKSLVVRFPASGPLNSALQCWKPCANLPRNAWSGGLKSKRCSSATPIIILHWPAKPNLNCGGAQQVAWLAQLDQEQENLRAALQWLLEKAQDRPGGSRAVRK